jgi:hypothetical protein
MRYKRKLSNSPHGSSAHLSRLVAASAVAGLLALAVVATAPAHAATPHPGAAAASPAGTNASPHSSAYGMTGQGSTAGPASAATRNTPPPSTLSPRLAADCTNQLIIFGYTVTTLRAAICYTAGLSAGLNETVKGAAVGVCTGGLKATGVGIVASGAACLAAVGPAILQYQEECYYNGGYACLNAWGGGPYVNAYAGGPETSDTHQDFVILDNEETGYYELAYVGSEGDSGECIGDYNNNSGLADAGLVGCGTASGNQGWGTNMDWGTNDCPSGEAWFYDYHWNGYLGPPNNYVNGSHFYLNKPWPTTGNLCFSVTFDS